MEDLIGKRYSISGMDIEVIADEGDNWRVQNITTRETLAMDKKMLGWAIRFGKAEQLEQSGDD